MRKHLFLVALAALGGLLVACGGPEPSRDFPNNNCGDFDHANCVRVASNDAAGLLEAVNSLSDDTVIILGVGTYDLENEVTVRADRIAIVGQGMDETILTFASATVQINGISAVSDGFLVQDLTVLDVPKDGIRVEDSDGVTYRRIKATWSTPASSENGAYGIYPVRSSNVLVEDSVAEHSSDAGLYVGQCRNVIVRNNYVTGNVAGLEIENTQFADVYGNRAENNTAGIMVFDLPGNPIVGRDVRIHDNMILNNNLRNFAPGGTVREIPAGTGTFAMASRRVEIMNNTYSGNNTGDIAIISGLVIEPDPGVWEHPTAALVGEWEDLGLLPGAAPDTITNFRSENIVVSGNTHMATGAMPDSSREFGAVLTAIFFPNPVPAIIYDTVGESMFDPEIAENNSNDNHICVGGDTGATGFTSINVPGQLVTIGSPVLVLTEAPFAPFDCTSLLGEPIPAITIP